jgi:hypothetical protein
MKTHIAIGLIVAGAALYSCGNANTSANNNQESTETQDSANLPVNTPEELKAPNEISQKLIGKWLVEKPTKEGFANFFEIEADGSFEDVLIGKDKQRFTGNPKPIRNAWRLSEDGKQLIITQYLLKPDQPTVEKFYEIIEFRREGGLILKLVQSKVYNNKGEIANENKPNQMYVLVPEKV